MPEPPLAHKRNQSVGKAASILRAAAERPDGESVTGLAQAAAMPRATALRMIEALVAERLLIRTESGERLVLGPELLRMARQVDLDQILVEVSRGLLEQLAAETRETVTLSVVRDQRVAEVVHQVDGPSLLRAVDWVGRSYPYHASSSGKLLLSFWTDERVAATLEEPFHAFTEKTLTTHAELREELSRIRTTGFAASVDELEEGLAGVSVPVYQHHRVVAMINAHGPGARFTEPERTKAVVSMHAGAERMARELAP